MEGGGYGGLAERGNEILVELSIGYCSIVFLCSTFLLSRKAIEVLWNGFQNFEKTFGIRV